MYVESCTDIYAVPRDTKEKKEKRTDYENAVSGWIWSEIDDENGEWLTKKKIQLGSKIQMFNTGAEVGELKNVRCTDALPRDFVFGWWFRRWCRWW